MWYVSLYTLMKSNTCWDISNLLLTSFCLYKDIFHRYHYIVIIMWYVSLYTLMKSNTCWDISNLLLTSFCLYTLRLKQNGWHHADNIFKCILVNEKYYILIQISLKIFSYKGLIENSIGCGNGLALHRWQKRLYMPFQAPVTFFIKWYN